jgi:hypothetical protein
MGKNTFPPAPRHALGMLGLLLLLVVAKLVPAAYDGPTTVTGRIRGVLARRAIDAIAGIGWAVDRIPPRRQAARRSPSRDKTGPHRTLRPA